MRQDHSESTDQFQPDLYVPPGTADNMRNTWAVPRSARILSDIRACQFSITSLLNEVLGENATDRDSVSLLAAIIESLKENEQDYEKFKQYQIIAEEAELVLIERCLRSRALSGEDLASTKFYLERRAPDKYGRASKEVVDPAVEEMKNLISTLKNGKG